MVRFFFASLLFMGAVSSCTPRAGMTAAERYITAKPVLFKVSGPVVRGGTLVIQGRFLGGPASGQVYLGAESDGTGGLVLPQGAIQAWTADTITLTVPADLPPGGGFLFVRVGQLDSNTLSYSVGQ